MADRWHTQVAVRFPPEMLEALDRLVASNYGEALRPWYQYGRATRSSVLLALVREADRRQREAEVNAEGEKKKPAKRVKLKKRGAK